MAVVDAHRPGFGGAGEAPNGLTEAFAFDIPERDVEGGEGRHEDRAVAVARKLVVGAVPVVLDAGGVIAGEVGSEPLNGFFDDFDAAGDRAFADAGDAAVGFHFEEEVVAAVDCVLAGGEIPDSQLRAGEEDESGKEAAPGGVGGERHCQKFYRLLKEAKS